MSTTIEADTSAATNATTAETRDHVTVLRHVSWATYESLMKDYEDSSLPHFAYDRGVLEIVSPSFVHENLKDSFTLLVSNVAEALDLDFVPCGSTTFRREDIGRGFEPDASFYFQNAALIAGNDKLDLTQDPPPDLVIEIDLTHSSLDKLPIYAELGIPEVWRYDGRKLVLYKLENQLYTQTETSSALSVLTREAIINFVNSSRTTKRAAWLRSIREWTREQPDKQN